MKTIAVVSLSRGLLGESKVKHELDKGVKRLEDYGLEVRFMPHALKGLKYVQEHPEDRAADLLEAFRDPKIDMILCAIGGNDTYRLLPYLFENDELKNAVSEKIFLGFSDTTVNHLMLHKVGLNTFYGQAFLPDVCELDSEMLPYTKKYFEELITTGTIREITPSDVWYESRTDFSVDAIDTPLISHPDNGFELLQGPPVFSGKILGGCIESLYDFFHSQYYEDLPELCEKYDLFPATEDWRGRILLLETSELYMPPEEFRSALRCFKSKGVFGAVSGILFGKPMDRIHESEYKQALIEEIGDPALPIVCNINIGHALPRCIIPFGVPATVDAEKQLIRFEV
ncbi:MAG: LD-carboxypeptidase [Clostridia bacterium]|nr:LD-carboxypeptidase [Clostridia bacterium]MBQ2110561.1 LD-carboxypeptidase [Clostridia bacterium]MBQ2191201.1 LD-carboxypeptidase [Clostridia bacterium]